MQCDVGWMGHSEGDSRLMPRGSDRLSLWTVTFVNVFAKRTGQIQGRVGAVTERL